MTTIKTQNYGTEIEMTGITRAQAAQALGKLWGTTPSHIGGVTYDKWTVEDCDGKTWTIMRDGSIYTEKRISGTAPTGGKQYISTPDKNYSVELVSPILTYEEQPKLQEAVRTVRHAGAKVNDSCGMHIHIDGANHTAKKICFSKP